MSQQPLYKPTDPVQILDDSHFFYSNGKAQLKNDKFKGPGAIKAYASWCPHCKNKINCIKELGELFHNEGLCMYVIDADVNHHFALNQNVQGFPTFYSVNKKGVVDGTLKLNGNDVHTVPDIVKSLCNDYTGICGVDKKLSGSCN